MPCCLRSGYISGVLTRITGCILMCNLHTCLQVSLAKGFIEQPGRYLQKAAVLHCLVAVR